VLHIIDGLGGGGSQRWIWDIVRLTPPETARYLVLTVQLDETGSPYVDRLRRHGVYEPPGASPVLRFVGSALDGAVVRLRRNPSPPRVYPGWLLQAYVAALRRLVAALRRFRPDLIHAHTFHGFAAALVARRLRGIPLVHSVPCLFSQMVDAGFSWMPGLYARAHPWVERFFTGASIDELVGCGVPRTKIEPIEASVDLDAVTAAEDVRDRHTAEIRRTLGLPPAARIALSVGRLHPSKGHRLALEALPRLVARHPALHWVVLGEGDDRPILERRASALGIQAHVHLIGFREDPLPYYAAANVYLRTPVFEAENLCSYYAMATGLPVVGFDTGAPTELIPKVGHGIIVPNHDSNALAVAVDQVLSSPDRGRRKGRLGAEYCREHLDIRLTIQQFVQAYHTLGARRRERR
jgi:glycosyltransferase involved in cell wall biosynthesis